MACKLFLQVFLDDEIQIVRVPLPHGAVCRTRLFDRAGGPLLPMRNRRAHGSSGNLPTVSSKTSGSVSVSDRCSRNCRRGRAIASRWSVRTGRILRRRTGFLITIGSAKRRYSLVISKRPTIEFGQQPVRCWCCTTRQSSRSSETTSKQSVKLGSILPVFIATGVCDITQRVAS